MAAKKKSKGGALANDPKKKTQQTTNANSMVAPSNVRGKDRAKWYADRGLSGANTPISPVTTNPVETGPTVETVENTANQGMQQYMDQMQSQGAFNPGSFDQLQRQAQDSVMNNFNRQMQPQFDREQANFRQRMAEQGIMAGTEGYNTQLEQLTQSQNNARQSAVDQSFATGLGAQNQAFGQASTQYQMPAQMLGAYAPFYGGQVQQGMQTNQQGFLGSQAEMDRQHQEDMQRQQFGFQTRLQQSAPRGGGGMSYDQQLGLQNNAFYNNMALNGFNSTGGQMPTIGNGIAGGVAQGVGAMVGGLLR